MGQLPLLSIVNCQLSIAFSMLAGNPIMGINVIVLDEV